MPNLYFGQRYNARAVEFRAALARSKANGGDAKMAAIMEQVAELGRVAGENLKSSRERRKTEASTCPATPAPDSVAE